MTNRAARQGQIEAQRFEGGVHSKTMDDDGESICRSRSKLVVTCLCAWLITACGSQKHGVQGAMFWEWEEDQATHGRTHIALHDLMTNPANLQPSTPWRVNNVGTTCIHYL